MDNAQRLLELIVNLGAPSGTDSGGEWFTIVPNDPDELGQVPSPIGIRVKVAGNTADGTNLRIVDMTTYNR